MVANRPTRARIVNAWQLTPGPGVDSSRSNVWPSNLLAVGLPMLARWVLAVWGVWLGALGLAAALTATGTWNTNPILPLGLSVLMFAAGLGLVIATTVRLTRYNGSHIYHWISGSRSNEGSRLCRNDNQG